MMVAYEKYSNATMADPTKSKEGKELTRACRDIKKTLRDIGINQKYTFWTMSALIHLKFLCQKKRNLFSW